jgi:hypothetical protein
MVSHNRIQAAIRECLDSYVPGGLPIAHLANYLDHLHEDPAWEQAEIHEVEATVRYVLATLVAGNPEPELAEQETRARKPRPR